jgi:membrane protein DedA with SNARE-associated domain
VGGRVVGGCVVGGGVVSGLLHQLLGLRGAVVYLIVAALVFGEDALFIGFVVPGETAAILGGVAASRGNVSLPVICAVAVVAAIAADSTGYAIGARYGERVLALRPVRRRRERIDAARARLARRGGPAVFAGRFLAFLHAVMPFLAGTSHMPYPRFLVYNGAGGILWGTGTVLLGYLAGNSYEVIEKTFGRAAALLAVAVVVIALIGWKIHRRRRKRAADPEGRDRRAEHAD